MQNVFALLVIIGLIGMVAAFLWIWRKNARDMKALRERGVATSATVVRHSTTQSNRGSNKTTYWLKLEYTANNAPYTQSIWVYKDTYDSFPDGSTIDILYLEENPKVITRK